MSWSWLALLAALLGGSAGKAVESLGSSGVCSGCPTEIGGEPVCWDPKCLTGGLAGCNAGGRGQECRFCRNNPAATPCLPSTGPTTRDPSQCHGCAPVGGQSVCWDVRCRTESLGGCNANGQGAACRFCSPSDRTLPHCYAYTGPPTAAPTGPTVAPGRCQGPNALAQTQCTQAEAIKAQCSFGAYVCLSGAAGGGCSPEKWTKSNCNCACHLTPLPVETCPWETYIFAPCNSKVTPFYCPTTGGCGPKPMNCPGLCSLAGPAPFPHRPASNHTYTPSTPPKPQNLVCGYATSKPGPKCTVQPNSPHWPYSPLRNAKCAAGGRWCPDGSDWDGPSKFQCGPTMQNNASLCPMKSIQQQAARVAPHYVPPAWAPQLPKAAPNDYCDCVKDCDAIRDAQHCVGCCTWDNPNLRCRKYSELGKGASCTKVSPRWNWILTTCDTMGGQAFGGACQQNPFSTVDVRYIAYYQLAQDAKGNTVWQLVPDSSLNWKGEDELVDFSALPTEHTATQAGPVRSCSGGGGGWNGAFFPYKSNGASPPAILAVLSYKRFYNAAWFILNQRTLDGGPDTPTTKSQTNCWGEISGGEIDFLETPNLFPAKFQNKAGWNVYRTTSYNAANRCFACNHGMKNGSFNLAGCGGEPAGTFYDANEESHSDHGHLWAAVIDARGTTLYKDPQWPGLSTTCAASTLINLHPAQPAQQQPCKDPNSSCGIYLPSCVTKVSPAMTRLTGGDVSRIPRCDSTDWALHTTCTNNWWNLMMDTGQWLLNDPPLFSPA